MAFALSANMLLPPFLCCSHLNGPPPCVTGPLGNSSDALAQMHLNLSHPHIPISRCMCTLPCPLTPDVQTTSEAYRPSATANFCLIVFAFLLVPFPFFPPAEGKSPPSMGVAVPEGLLLASSPKWPSPVWRD